MFQEAIAAGIAVIIEGNDPVGHIDMVAPKAFARNDPLCVKSCKGRTFEEHACEDVTGAVAKEDAVGQCPPSLRVFLDSGLEDVHVAGIVASALASKGCISV
jgi:hypothetical protein